MSARPEPVTPFPYLDNLTCETKLPWMPLINQLEKAMAKFSQGKVQMPVRTMIHGEKGLYGLMPCYSPEDNGLSCKLVCVFPENGKLNLPSHIVYVLLFDANTGKVKVMMDGEGITRRRTAATSALSARWLAKPGPRNLSVIGAGHQALSHIQVLTKAYPNIDVINIWNHRHHKATELAEHVSAWLDTKTVKVHETVDSCVSQADLIVTATLASEPVVLSPGNSQDVHMMCVGAPVAHQSEVAPEVWNRATVFVDSRGGALKESGDILNAGCPLKAELGEVIQKGDRRNVPGGLTMFKSLGLAVQDLVSAQMAGKDIRSASPLPVPFWTAKQVGNSLASAAKEAKCNSKTTEINTGRFHLTFKGMFLESDLLVCEVKSKQVASDTVVCHYMLAYKGETGELTGVLEAAPLEGKAPGEVRETIRNLLHKQSKL